MQLFRLNSRVRGEHLTTQFRWAPDPLSVTLLRPNYPVSGLLLVRSGRYMGYETLWPRVRCVGQTNLSDNQWIGHTTQSVKSSIG